MKKIANWIIKLLGGIPGNEIKKENNILDRISGSISVTNDLNDNYLFDFTNYSSGRDRIVAFEGSEDQKTETKKIKIKPVDVLHELETVPHPFNLENLDSKVAMLKDKEKLISQHYAKREVTALIERLELRKKYNDFKDFFTKFQNTTDEKIDAILSRYELVMKTSDIFIPEFPDDAIATMKDYTEQMEKLCGKKPIFYVIAEEKDFKKAWEKRDPILLVQSPFGFYWQILGAWDKEMLLLSEF